MEGTKVSSRDAAVLSRVFNPELPFDETEYQNDFVEDMEEDDAEELEIRRVEREAVRCAESGDLASALDQLNSLIAIHRDRPSLYNNRAQILQLLGDRKGALADVTEAVKLVGVEDIGQMTPELLNTLKQANSLTRQAATQALTQMGVILRVEEEDERALRCFQVAGQLGSAFAKEMVVKLNPYAALCGSMLSQVFDRLQRGEPEF